MVHEETTAIDCKIIPSIKKNVLTKGTCIAFIGAFVIVLSSFLPIEYLKHLGFPLFAFSLWIIKKGLSPYKILQKKELICDQLILNNGTLSYTIGRKPILTVSKKDIKSINYFENSKEYGIVLILKKGNIEIFDNALSLKKIQKQGKKRNADLFFPFFPKETLEKIL